MIYRVLAKNVLLPISDLFRGTKIAEYRKILETTQWLKKDEIVRLQRQRLRALLNQAYENVPHYHRVFKERGLRPSDIKTVEDLKKLPVLKKMEIRTMPQQLIAKNLPQREMIPFRTSGTTAEPLKFYRTKEDVSWGIAAMFRAYGWAQHEFGDKYAATVALQPHELKNPLSMIENLIKRQDVSLNVYEISENSIRPFVQRMRRFRLQYVRGYSAPIHILAKYILTEGISLKLKAIFATSTTLLPSQRRTIEKAFGCEVYDSYGSSEFSWMASECGKHSGYHVHSDNVVMEIVKNGEQVAAGETGAILVTGLHNYAMPFIRYDIGDIGKPSDETCSCGRGLPLIESIEGRTYEYFMTGDGSMIFLKDLDVFFENLPVKMFQIVQRNYGDLVIKVVKANGYSEKDTDFIKRNIVWNLQQPKVEVEVVDSIPSEKSGKRRYVISKMPMYDWLEES